MSVQPLSREAAVVVPRLVASTLINGVVRQSAALSTFSQVPTLTRDSIIPVLNRDVEASWVQPADIGLKTTGVPEWAAGSLTAEELAVLVPIPQNVLDDSEYNITNAMSPLFTRAMARGIDRACFFGLDSPAGWTSPSLLAAATAAGNIVEAGSDDDPVESLLTAAELVSNEGYAPDAAVVRPGWQYRAAKIRSRDLVANPAGAGEPFPVTIAGLPVYLDPPAFVPSQATAFVIDSSCVMIGMRQDLDISVHPDGIISDPGGAVVFNAMQQDSVITRVTMRLGYLLARPPTDAGLPADQRAPVAAVVPAGSGSGGGAAPPEPAQPTPTRGTRSRAT